MTNLTALIAEDEEPQRLELEGLIRDLWPELALVAVCSDGLAALEAVEAHHPSVLFLDIRMPGSSGLAVARAAGRNAHVVFTTAYDDHAVAAFEEGAVDYILKPVQRERLEKAIDRVRTRLEGALAPPPMEDLLDRLIRRMRGDEAKRLQWITAGAGDTVKLFPIGDVLYFQADEKYTRVATLDETALIRVPLKDLLERLDPDQFWQVHRSVIVRASAIEHAKRDELGKLRLKIRGRDEMLPVSIAFQGRFRIM
jgi:DNA-binding LytR/AlgR family response regulator